MTQTSTADQQIAPVKRSLVRNFSTLAVTLIGLLLLILAAVLWPVLIMPLLILCGPVYLGVLLPLRVGREERRKRAEQIRQQSLATWGFVGRDRAGPWLNYIDYPLARYCEALRGHYFYGEWLILHDGLLVINPGHAQVDRVRGEVSYDFDHPRTYAWDGCTPKIAFYWLLTFGSPDWWDKAEPIQRIEHGTLVTTSVFWPLTHHASLVHDALYQYLNVAPVSKAQADRLFHTMLLEAGMLRPLAALYYLAVRLGGARSMRDRNNPDSPLRCLTVMPTYKAVTEPPTAAETQAAT